jgi:c-di-GMP-binding flagellar brake protein YcgR
LWIALKKRLRVNFLKGDSMKNGEKEPTSLHKIGNFEKRRHPRCNVDLPVEYRRRDLVVKQDRVVNASEGGLLTYLSEQVEVGQHLRIRLFFPLRSGLNVIEMVTQVVWMQSHPEKRRGDYHTGVKFIEVSPDDLGNLRRYLGSLAG